MYPERPGLTSQFDVSQLQKQLRNGNADSFGPVCQLWFVTLKCKRENRPQQKSFKVTRDATNRDIHINETFKLSFVNNLIKISRKYTQSMFSNKNICFNVFNIRTYGEFLCNLAKLMKLQKERPLLTSQFDVSKTIKSALKCNADSFGPVCQLWSVTLKCMRDNKPQNCDQQQKW